MRILEYQMQMTGFYHLTNYPLAEDSEDLGSATRPGIRLIVEQCNDLEDLVEGFSCMDADEEKEFGPIKREVLLGESKDWVLTTVDVRGPAIWLLYSNPKYTRQATARRECVHQGETIDEESRPHDLFRLELLFYPNDGAILRFVTPRNDGSGDADTTLVKIPSNPKESLVVTEFDGHKRRELTFLGNYSPEGDEYIWVKEFM